MKPVGVVLSGEDFADGTEFHEAFLLLSALQKYGIKNQCIVVNDMQQIVIEGLFLNRKNEMTSPDTDPPALALNEIISLKESVPENLSALIFPGGFGAVRGLTTLETDGSDYIIDVDLLALAQEIHKLHKPLGFISQSGILAPKIAGVEVRVTLGTDLDRAELLDAIGAESVSCPADDVVVNLEMKIVSTPGLLSEQSDGQAAVGIDKLVRCVMEWVK